MRTHIGSLAIGVVALVAACGDDSIPVCGGKVASNGKCAPLGSGGQTGGEESSTGCAGDAINHNGRCVSASGSGAAGGNALDSGGGSESAGASSGGTADQGGTGGAVVGGSAGSSGYGGLLSGGAAGYGGMLGGGFGGSAGSAGERPVAGTGGGPAPADDELFACAPEECEVLCCPDGFEEVTSLVIGSDVDFSVGGTDTVLMGHAGKFILLNGNTFSTFDPIDETWFPREISLPGAIIAAARVGDSWIVVSRAPLPTEQLFLTKLDDAGGTLLQVALPFTADAQAAAAGAELLLAANGIGPLGTGGSGGSTGTGEGGAHHAGSGGTGGDSTRPHRLYRFDADLVEVSAVNLAGSLSAPTGTYTHASGISVVGAGDEFIHSFSRSAQISEAALGTKFAYYRPWTSLLHGAHFWFISQDRLNRFDPTSGDLQTGSFGDFGLPLHISFVERLSVQRAGCTLVLAAAGRDGLGAAKATAVLFNGGWNNSQTFPQHVPSPTALLSVALTINRAGALFHGQRGFVQPHLDIYECKH